MNDFYELLGISKSATQDEIKLAYRKLASKHHPDKGGDTATFQQIQAAYETLSDVDKRADYDNPAPKGHHFHSGNPQDLEEMMRHFGSMFGNSFGQQARPQRNSTVAMQTAITLDDAFAGKELVATIKLPSGIERVLNVKIPPGIVDGTTLRLKELGDETIPELPKGDIHLTVRIIPHATFHRHGDDLIKEITISAFDAMLGTILEINTIDNKTLNITVPPGTQYGAILGAHGYGMPNMNNNLMKGRLLIPIKVSIPTNLTDTQKEFIINAKT